MPRVVDALHPQRLALALVRPELVLYARFDIGGVDRIPRTGGAILCANHRSYFDAVAVAMTLARSGRTARFLGKKEVFDVPVVGRLARAFGGIRVDRGSGSDEPLHEAAEALRQGHLVGIMPQGTIPRGSAFFEPRLEGRWGAARLAQQTGAPVIPMGLWGTDRVWPRSARIPNVTNVLDPPTVRVRVGSPVDLSGASVRTATRHLMDAIMDLLPPEARRGHTPTDEELARTFPPGYRGDPAGETKRRPGRD
jgi:putative phosphoserine phosphatase/1-acylglycerol-3-phosphate O-acyltransferase